jgi:RecA-family ATPase
MTATAPKLRWFSEAMTTLDEPVSWVIEDLIAEGDRVVVYGQWRAFKTYLLLDWGLRIPAGLSVGNLFAVSKPRRVLYINEEMSDRSIWRRVKRLAKGLGVVADQLPFAVVSRSGIRLKAKHPSIQRLLVYIQDAKLQPGDVVIVDAFRRVLVGSEKDDEAVREFWRCVDEALSPLGLTILISHHMRKPRGKAQATTHEASGSGDVMAGGDNTIAVVRDSGDSVTVYQEKNREGEEVPPFVAAFEFPEDEDETGPVVVEYSPG